MNISCRFVSRVREMRLWVAAYGLACFCMSPALVFAASGYPALNTHYVQTQTSSSVLFSVWIPDANLLPQSVNVVELASNGQALGIVATLNDIGTQGDPVARDLVFSGYINVTDGIPKTHTYQATYALQKQLTRSKTPSVTVTSVAVTGIVSNATYYNGIDSSLTTLLDLLSQNSTLRSPSSSTRRVALDRLQRDASVIQFQFGALDAYGSTSSTAAKASALIVGSSYAKSVGFWATAASWLGLGNLTKKAVSEQNVFDAIDSTAFNPIDPIVQPFMQWYSVYGSGLCDISDISCRSVDLWLNYQAWEKTQGSSIIDVAQSTAADALVKQTAFQPVSDGTGELITNIYSPGLLGNVAVNAATEAGTGYIVDTLIDSNGSQKVLIGKFAPNETIQIPNGQHDILLSYSDQARDIISDIPVAAVVIQLIFNPGATAPYQQFSPGPFTYTGPMNRYRGSHQATLLNDGTVLVTGGVSADGVISAGKSAEIYDPSVGRWTAIASQMRSYRSSHRATKLPDGTVLLTGGGDNSAEIYAPSPQAFSSTGSMSQSRSEHEAVLLDDGRVMVVGGGAATVEIYSPKIGQWASAASLPFAGSGIFYHRAVLDKGKVLVFGGFDFSSGTTYASVYSFDPGTNVWTTMTPMSVARAEATLTLLPDGRVLIVGGGASSSSAWSTTEIYDPSVFNSTSAPSG